MKKNLVIGCGVVLGIVILIGIILVFSGISTYNKMVRLDEGVKEKWSQVENVYQRRLDLIPNLVETVKGYAGHERETLQAVTEARAKVGGVMNIPGQALTNPEMFQQFQQAQAGLSGALQRLMVVIERYPDLKANENFLSLQSQLEGTENRIAVERRRFNEASKEFNTYIRQFPKVILANMFGFREKPYFKAQEGADIAPKVKF
ncbi:MAG: LemA family protein [Candidatus Aminicenantes bacterium]|nr:MAG: LemA family protein [Candidatus Aminicenantes bacterium]